MNCTEHSKCVLLIFFVFTTIAHTNSSYPTSPKHYTPRRFLTVHTHTHASVDACCIREREVCIQTSFPLVYVERARTHRNRTIHILEAMERVLHTINSLAIHWIARRTIESNCIIRSLFSNLCSHVFRVVHECYRNFHRSIIYLSVISEINTKWVNWTSKLKSKVSSYESWKLPKNQKKRYDEIITRVNLSYFDLHFKIIIFMETWLAFTEVKDLKNSKGVLLLRLERFVASAFVVVLKVFFDWIVFQLCSAISK